MRSLGLLFEGIQKSRNFIQIMRRNFMCIFRLKTIINSFGMLFGIAALALSLIQVARADNRNGAPDLPSACESIEAPAGNKAFLRVYALGVQVYRWNGASWDFVAPEANLFANENYTAKIGTHYAGPTWEAIGGSKVVGMRVADCAPHSNTIPWLLLQSISNDGPGIFRRVTYIQRVNTTGGQRPICPGTSIGEEARIPYTAEYYFYRGR